MGASPPLRALRDCNCTAKGVDHASKSDPLPAGRRIDKQKLQDLESLLTEWKLADKEANKEELKRKIQEEEDRRDNSVKARKEAEGKEIARLLPIHCKPSATR